MVQDLHNAATDTRAHGAVIIWLGPAVFGLVKLLGGSVDQEPFKKACRDADQCARSAELALLSVWGSPNSPAFARSRRELVARDHPSGGLDGVRFPPSLRKSTGYCAVLPLSTGSLVPVMMPAWLRRD